MTPCRYYKDYKALRQPKCNCSFCWIKYFTTNPMKYIVIKELISKVGRVKTAAVYGDKLVKHYDRFRKQYGDKVEMLVEAYQRLISEAALDGIQNH